MTHKPTNDKPVETNDSKATISIEDMAMFCKRKAFVYPDSELYGGITGFFDYGPLGVELKNNIKQQWWKRFVRSRQDVVGIDGSIISHQKVWQASGHVGCFSDLMLSCEKCKQRFRADHLVSEALNIAIEGMKSEDINKLVEQNHIKCPACKGKLGEAKAFNLMFKTYVGPVE